MIKELLPGQVVCTVRSPKGKSCHGGLKRYYPFSSYFNESDPQLLDEIRREFSDDPKLVLLKCETCATLYGLPKVLKEKFRQSG